MKFDFTLMNIIFFGFCKLVLCQNLCSEDRNVSTCCSDYYYRNGRCVACPLGSFGVNCSKRCPLGFFGEFCAKVCHCPEKQICDTAHGCIDTEVLSTNLLIENYSTTDWQTTDLTTQQTTTLMDIETRTQLPAVPFYLYLVSLGCISLFFIICLLITYRRRRTSPGNEGHGTAPPTNDITCARDEEIPQPVNPNVDDVTPHDYIEIIDVDPTYLEPCSFSAA